ncbi:hypothetical protein CHARACLAT_029316 [Characodon lateralis]|uniref:Uncharacterized protein n=1 Tax=Characodon lateralis TaxID=208331 RepID=A0ABU7DB05_9TELE|nr:hypothetical protein [Characodon lateralis]
MKGKAGNVRSSCLKYRTLPFFLFLVTLHEQSKKTLSLILASSARTQHGTSPTEQNQRLRLSDCTYTVWMSQLLFFAGSALRRLFPSRQNHSTGMELGFFCNSFILYLTTQESTNESRPFPINISGKTSGILKHISLTMPCKSIELSHVYTLLPQTLLDFIGFYEIDQLKIVHYCEMEVFLASMFSPLCQNFAELLSTAFAAANVLGYAPHSFARYSILPKVLGPITRSMNSGVPIGSMAAGVEGLVWRNLTGLHRLLTSTFFNTFGMT